MEKTVCKSEQETKTIAETLAKQAAPGIVYYLSGPLGSGKTTFVRFFARALGVKEKVVSPTYNLLKRYPIPQKSFHLYHLDLYRLKEDELTELGLDETLDDNKNILLVEWPELVSNKFPNQNIIRINFSYGSHPGERIITIKQ